MSDDDFKCSADPPAKRSKLSSGKGKVKKSASEQFGKSVTIKKLDSLSKGYGEYQQEHAVGSP